MNRSTPGLHVHHQLPESTQTHVHWVGDAIQPSHPLSSPSPPALNLFPASGSFPMSWLSVSGGQSVGEGNGYPLQYSCLVNPMDWLHHARPLCPPLSPGVCSNSCPLSQWCYLTISSSAAPFSFCPQSFPSIRVFSKESALCIRWPKYGASASASVLPMNTQGWFLLGLTGLVLFDLKCSLAELRYPVSVKYTWVLKTIWNISLIIFLLTVCWIDNLDILS